MMMTMKISTLTCAPICGVTFCCFIGALLVGVLANYTGYLAPKLALFSTIGLMVGVLLWRPQGLYPVTNR